MKDLIFVSMPYSSEDPAVVEKRMDIFAKVMAGFAQRGECTVSPLTYHFINPLAPFLGSDWRAWKVHSETLLSFCTKLRILQIEGWDTSDDIKGEQDFAAESGIPIEFFTQEDIEELLRQP